MRMVVRVGAFALVIGVSYGLAVLLPDRVAQFAGFVAFAVVAFGTCVWAHHDGRNVPRDDGLRDWLVVSAVIAVFWWITLALFEGSHDVVKQLQLNFLSVLATAGVLYAAAVVGLALGRASRRV